MKVPGFQDYFDVSKCDQKNPVDTFWDYMWNETDVVLAINLLYDLRGSD